MQLLILKASLKIASLNMHFICYMLLKLISVMHCSCIGTKLFCSGPNFLEGHEARNFMT